MKGLLIFAILMVIGCLIVCIVIYIFRQKRLKEIEKELNLIQGHRYEVVVNNGAKRLNLYYSHIAYGNNSQNGSINIYFIKPTKYRGSYIDREVMIKYGNIWKITKITNDIQTADLEEDIEEEKYEN